MGAKRAGKKQGAGKSPGAVPVAAGNEQPSSTVALPADCRLAAQAALKARLEEVLPDGDIIIDATGLERVDTAALQLLVLFRRELEQRGGTLSWLGTNDVLAEAAGVLGLEQLLNLPAATLA